MNIERENSMNANAAIFTSAPSSTVARRYAACVNLFEGATTAGEAIAAAGRIEALELKGARFDGELYFQSLIDEVAEVNGAGDVVFNILLGSALDGWSVEALFYLTNRFGRVACNQTISWMMANITEWNDTNTLVWCLLEQ
jgi:hypothetical protein